MRKLLNILDTFLCKIMRRKLKCILVAPKKQNFWLKINILKGNHCILRTGGAPVCQKLGMILEDKVVQKLKLEKNGFFLNGLLN